MPTSGEISPKQQELGSISVAIGRDLAKTTTRKETRRLLPPNLSEIPQQKVKHIR